MDQRTDLGAETGGSAVAPNRGRRGLLLGLLLFAGGAWPGCRSNPPVPASTVPVELVVASDLDNRPFAWADERGLPRGRDVDMMNALAQDLGVRLSWRRLPFEELLPTVARGDVDVVCATLGITPERAQEVAFTRPYFQTTLDVVVRRGTGEPASLADLAGRRVAAARGTTSERAVIRSLPRSFGVFDNPGGRPAAERLAGREVDAVVLDGPAARELVAADPSLTRLEPALAVERYALAVRPDRPDIQDALSRALARLDLEGGLELLDRSWHLRD